jgi:hypothetical protein
MHCEDTLPKKEKEMNTVPAGPKVCYETYEIQPPYIMCEVIIGDYARDIPFGLINGRGIGFAKQERQDRFDLAFGKRLARKRALADAERTYYRELAETAYEQRMREAKKIVEEKYPVPTTDAAEVSPVLQEAAEREPGFGHFLNTAFGIGRAISAREVEPTHE